MKQALLALLAATALLASCETKRSETKDQLGEAGQDTAVMNRHGRRPPGKPPRGNCRSRPVALHFRHACTLIYNELKTPAARCSGRFCMPNNQAEATAHGRAARR